MLSLAALWRTPVHFCIGDSCWGQGAAPQQRRQGRGHAVGSDPTARRAVPLVSCHKRCGCALAVLAAGRSAHLQDDVDDKVRYDSRRSIRRAFIQ